MDMEAETLECGGDAAAFVLSRLPHPDDVAAGARAAFLHVATGRALSFAGLRSAALSLASALRLGLGIRRGEPVLVELSPDGASDVDPLLLPPILLGIVAAGCVAVVAAPGAAAAAVADVSRVAIVVGAGAVGTLPLLLASRSADPRALSAEELMDGGDPAALDAVDADDRPGPLEAALIVYSSTGKRELIRHTDLITAVAGAALPDEGRVCLASLPAWGTNIHDGLALLALGLPAAGATTVLLPPSSDLRAAVATHGATDVVATPEAAAALFFPALPQGKLATLRRVTVVTPLGDDAWQAFRRRLSWVDLAEMSGAPEMGAATAESPEQVAPAELGPLLLVQPEAAATQLKGKIPDQMPATSEATSLVSPLQKIQKTVLSDVFTKSVAGKFLRRNPVACDKQAVSKL